MRFIPADSGSLLAFLLVVGFVVACYFTALFYVSKKKKLLTQAQLKAGVIGAIAWIAFGSAYTLSGFPLSQPIPALPIFFACIFAVSFLLAFSKIGAAIARGIPLFALVAFQGFRLPLELVLHSWAEQGTVPQTMTWSGQNLDVISGIVAIAATPLVSQSRAFAWIANAVGFLLLMNVARVAMLSAPVPFGWNLESPLLVGMYLPYSWIATVCVVAALAGHLVLTRALLRR